MRVSRLLSIWVLLACAFAARAGADCTTTIVLTGQVLAFEGKVYESGEIEFIVDKSGVFADGVQLLSFNWRQFTVTEEDREIYAGVPYYSTLVARGATADSAIVACKMLEDDVSMVVTSRLAHLTSRADFSRAKSELMANASVASVVENIVWPADKNHPGFALFSGDYIFVLSALPSGDPPNDPPSVADQVAEWCNQIEGIKRYLSEPSTIHRAVAIAGGSVGYLVDRNRADLLAYVGELMAKAHRFGEQ